MPPFHEGADTGGAVVDAAVRGIGEWVPLVVDEAVAVADGKEMGMLEMPLKRMRCRPHRLRLLPVQQAVELRNHGWLRLGRPDGTLEKVIARSLSMTMSLPLSRLPALCSIPVRTGIFSLIGLTSPPSAL
jgi:hypothetical protein